MHIRQRLWTSLAALVLATGLGGIANAKECKPRSEQGIGTQIARSLGSSLLSSALGRAGVRDYYGVTFTLNNYLIDSFACMLDKQEQEKAANATMAALEAPPEQSSEKVEWVSETNNNVSGSVEATPVTVASNGKQCRTATQIGYVDGKEIRATPTFCREPGSSTWVAQA